HACGIRLERGRGELDIDNGARKSATTTLRALILRLPGNIFGRDLFVAVEDAVLESTPEFRRTLLKSGRRAGAGMSRRDDDRAIGLRELNLDLNFDDFVMRFVVQSRALRAVVGLPAGILDEKRERRQEADGRN